MSDSPNTTTLPEISRPILEAEIERLIDVLDQIDDYPDLESNSDEVPWLGASEARSIGHGTNWNGFNALDNDDREEDDADDEPWLGSANPNFHVRPGLRILIPGASRISAARTRETSQLGWASHGSDDDREEQCEDEGEPHGDAEPESENPSCYCGPCSPITTMVGPL